MTVSPELTKYQADLLRLRDEILALFEGMDAAGWSWSPAPGEWSIADTIDHINTVNRLVAPRVENAISTGRQQNLYGIGPFRYPIFDRLFVFALEPRAPVKQSAPGIYRPQSKPTLDQARAEFLGLQERLIAAVENARGLHLVKIKIPSPVNNLLRFSLGTWFAATIAHEENHLQQAQKVQQAYRRK